MCLGQHGCQRIGRAADDVERVGCPRPHRDEGDRGQAEAARERRKNRSADRRRRDRWCLFFNSRGSGSHGLELWLGRRRSGSNTPRRPPGGIGGNIMVYLNRNSVNK